MRGQGRPVIVLDGGDCFFISASKKAPERFEELKALRTARTILNAYNFMGYQALAVGPTDLQLGLGTLKDLAREARFPFLCANLVDSETKKPIFPASIVMEASGIKFGIYAVMNSDINETYRKRVLGEAALLLDAEKVTREIVPELRKTCDVVIALSHLNEDQNHRILDSNPGIDVLVDPLSRNGTKAIWVTADDYITTHNKVPVLRIDGQGSRIGGFEMYFAPGKNSLASFDGRDLPLGPEIQRHPEVEELVRDFEHGRKDPVAVDFDPKSPRTVEIMGAEGCGACHDEQLAFWKASKHADTYSTLVKTEDQFRMDCVGCHSSGYGVAFADAKNIGRFKEVQCESCHGFQREHADNPKKSPFGAVSEENCWGCHNPEITQKEFNITEVKDKVSCPKIVR